MGDELLDLRTFLLEQAGDTDGLHHQLLDIRWMMEKLFRFGPEAVDADLARISTPETRALRSVLGRCRHLIGSLDDRESQLATVLGRVLSEPVLARAAQQFRRSIRFPYLENAWEYQDGASSVSSVISVAPSGRTPVTFVHFSPDGALTFIGYENGVVDVRRTETGDLLNRLALQARPEFPSSANCLATVSDDSIAVGYSDSHVRLWNLTTGECHEPTFVARDPNFSGGAPRGDGILRLACVSGRDYILVGDRQNKFTMWNWKTNNVMLELEVEQWTYSNFAGIPAAIRGRFFAMGSSSSGEVKVWDLDQRFHLGSLYLDAGVSSLAFTDGTLVSRDEAGRVYVWTVPELRLLGSIPGALGDVVLDRTFEKAALPVIGDRIRLIRNWHDLSISRETPPPRIQSARWINALVRAATDRVRLPERRVQEHTYVMCIGGSQLGWFTTATNHVTEIRDTVSGAHSVKFFDASGVLRHTVEVPNECVRLVSDPGERWVSTVTSVGDVLVWMLSDLSNLHIVRETGSSDEAQVSPLIHAMLNVSGVYANSDRRVTACAVSKEGVLAVGHRSGHARIVKIPAEGGGRSQSANRRIGKMTKCSAAQSGSWVAMVGPDRIVNIRTATAGGEFVRLPGTLTGKFSDDASVPTVLVADENHVAGIDDDGTVRVWSVKSGQQVGLIRELSGELCAAGHMAEASWVAVASQNGDVLLWDVQRAMLRTRLVGHRDQVRRGVFVPRCNVLITIDSYSDARIWNMNKTVASGYLTGSPNPYDPVVVDPAGVWIAGNDSTFRQFTFWSPSDGSRRGYLEASGAVRAAASSPNGMRLVTVSASGEVELWDAPSGRKVADFNAASDQVTACSVSRSGRFLAVVDLAGILRVYDTESGNQLISVAVDGELHDCCWLEGDQVCLAGLGGGYLFGVSSG